MSDTKSNKGRAEDGWLLVREAAAETGITTGRIYALINSHRLTAELREVGVHGARVLVVRAQEVVESDAKARGGEAKDSGEV